MAGTKKAIGMFGSAAVLAFAVGFGGVGVSSLGSTPTPTPQPVATVAPAPAQAPSGIHILPCTGGGPKTGGSHNCAR